MELSRPPRLTSNSWSSYLSLPNVGAMVTHHHTYMGRHCFSPLGVLIIAQGEFHSISAVSE